MMNRIFKGLEKVSARVMTCLVLSSVCLSQAYGSYLPIGPLGPDLSCVAKLESPGAKTRKVRVDRKAHVRLGPNLTILFYAPYFDGIGSVDSYVAIYDAETEQPIKILSSVVTSGWKFEASEETKFGLVSIRCH